MSRLLRVFSISCFAMSLAVPSILAQQAQDPGQPPAPQQLDKEQKRKVKKTLKELETPYRTHGGVI